MHGPQPRDDVFGLLVLVLQDADLPIQQTDFVHLIGEDLRAPPLRLPEQSQDSFPRDRRRLSQPTADSVFMNAEVSAHSYRVPADFVHKHAEAIDTVDTLGGVKEHGEPRFMASDGLHGVSCQGRSRIGFCGSVGAHVLLHVSAFFIPTRAA